MENEWSLPPEEIIVFLHLDGLYTGEQIAKAQRKQLLEWLEKYVFYIDRQGYIALKANATLNYQALLHEIRLE